MRKFAVIALVLFSAGCVQDEMGKEQRIGTPNPASAYCVAQGGTIEIRKEANGQVGYCRLPDGLVIEEWALFRAENARKG